MSQIKFELTSRNTQQDKTTTLKRTDGGDEGSSQLERKRFHQRSRTPEAQLSSSAMTKNKTLIIREQIETQQVAGEKETATYSVATTVGLDRGGPSAVMLPSAGSLLNVCDEVRYLQRSTVRPFPECYIKTT